MSKKIIVTPEDLRKTANDISNLAADYESKYNQFYNEVNTLTGENLEKINFEQVIIPCPPIPATIKLFIFSSCICNSPLLTYFDA